MKAEIEELVSRMYACRLVVCTRFVRGIGKNPGFRISTSSFDPHWRWAGPCQRKGLSVKDNGTATSCRPVSGRSDQTARSLDTRREGHAEGRA
jgi:hypothetical protein